MEVLAQTWDYCQPVDQGSDPAIKWWLGAEINNPGARVGITESCSVVVLCRTALCVERVAGSVKITRMVSISGLNLDNGLRRKGVFRLFRMSGLRLNGGQNTIKNGPHAQNTA
jgi:hypothetical protein